MRLAYKEAFDILGGDFTGIDLQEGESHAELFQIAYAMACEALKEKAEASEEAKETQKPISDKLLIIYECSTIDKPCLVVARKKSRNCRIIRTLYDESAIALYEEITAKMEV